MLRIVGGGLALVAFGAAVAMFGCSNKPDPPVEPGKQGPPTVQGKPANSPNAALHRTFAEAIVSEPPLDVERPPDVMINGKRTAKLHEQICGPDGKSGLWPTIRFVAADGKNIRYAATLKTDHGDIRIDLLSEDAPNHVRSFIALAKVGYFDGLRFDTIMKRPVNDTPWTYMDVGCPLGTGESGYGGVGYWLRPEISPKLVHEEGTVGATHYESVESAGGKFYISLGKAPWMDGNYTIFGKITQGLDVARKIGQLPTQEDRPTNPVIVREVIIHTMDDAPVVARNP